MGGHRGVGKETRVWREQVSECMRGIGGMQTAQPLAVPQPCIQPTFLRAFLRLVVIALVRHSMRQLASLHPTTLHQTGYPNACCSLYYLPRPLSPFPCLPPCLIADRQPELRRNAACGGQPLACCADCGRRAARRRVASDVLTILRSLEYLQY